MATNPMKRRAKIAGLLGALITLVITGSIIAFLMVKLKDYKEKEAEEIANSVKVWVLSQDVKSGQVITTDMLKQQTINKNVIPTNAIGDMTILSDYSLEDKEGNEVITEYKNNVATLYLRKNGTKYELKMEDETGSYYIEEDGEKSFVVLAEVPVVAKVDMNKNTIITVDTIAKSNEKITDDLRKQEYNMLVLPTQLESGEYIDIRLSLPTGQDYIIVSKKQVEIPQVGGIDLDDTIWVKLNEEETITMNNAMVDAYRILGSKLYVTTYTEAGMQEAATPTYVPTESVKELIKSNPNVVETARNELVKRYNNYYEAVRNEVINPSINYNGEEGEDNLKTKVNESISNSKENRKQYLDSLAGDY